MHTQGLDGRFKKKNGVIDEKKIFLTWADDGIKAFHCLREIMMSDRVLIRPDFLKEFEFQLNFIKELEYGTKFIIRTDHQPLE